METKILTLLNQAARKRFTFKYGCCFFPNEGQRKKIKQKKETKRERLFKKGFSSGGKRKAKKLAMLY